MSCDKINTDKGRASLTMCVRVYECGPLVCVCVWVCEYKCVFVLAPSN